MGQKKPPRTPEEREVRRAEMKAGRIAKIAKKENQTLKKLQKAAKKAKDFEVRKLKRRLRLIEVAENMPVTDTEDKLDVKAGGEAALDPPKRLPKHEKGNKEGVKKQLQCGLQLCHLAVAQMAGQELELGITKDAEINLRGSGAAEEPVSDELLTAFATRLLQHKAVREEVTEAKSFVEKLKADNEKAERRAAKSARKAASKAASEAAKAERAALGLTEEGNNEAVPSGEGGQGTLPPPPSGSKKQRRMLKVKERREQKKEQKLQKKITMGQRARARAALQVKDKSKYAVKNPEQHAVKKALRLKKRKAKEETKRAAEAAGVSPPSKKAKKAKKTTDGGLHPSWVAKKQQTVSISQEKPTGKKVIFGD